MRINADLTQRAVVEGASLPWVPSPLPGVHRRMLEREGDEVARVTSIVRYAPQSYFSEHTHIGGEEYLVLEGTFSDQYGNFPAGTYVRNPVGSKHKPHTEQGCVILVKLYWMHADDQAYVRMDTGSAAPWKPSEIEGVHVLDLHRYRDERVALYRLEAGAALPARDLPGGEEFFVLEGECFDASGRYPTACWVRTPIGEAPALSSESGCLLYVKRGYLADVPPGPPQG